MTIETDYRKSKINLNTIDFDNEIYISISDEYVVLTYLNINEAKQLIKFLQEQIDTFNSNDIRRNNS